MGMSAIRPPILNAKFEASSAVLSAAKSCLISFIDFATTYFTGRGSVVVLLDDELQAVAQRMSRGMKNLNIVESIKCN